MGIDVIDLFGGDARLVEGHAHAALRSFSFRERRSHVVSVRSQTVSRYFSVNSGSALASVLEFFEDQNACALPHDEAVTSLVEGARCFLWGVIARGECFHGCESADAEWDDGRFGAACEKDVGIAFADHAPRFADGMGGGCTSGDGGVIGALEAIFHGDQAAGHVGDHHGDHKRGDAAGPFSH